MGCAVPLCWPWAAGMPWPHHQPVPPAALLLCVLGFLAQLVLGGQWDGGAGPTGVTVTVRRDMGSWPALAGRAPGPGSLFSCSVPPSLENAPGTGFDCGHPEPGTSVLLSLPPAQPEHWGQGRGWILPAAAHVSPAQPGAPPPLPPAQLCRGATLPCEGHWGCRWVIEVGWAMEPGCVLELGSWWRS